jgi:RNA polymerase sigma factor (sigma-70 family)
LSSLTRTATKKTIILSELLLVEQCKQQNRKAQMALYRQYCDGMFIVAHRYMKDEAAAEDALQEAFIKAFRKLDQFKGDVTFGAWLKRIVINTCLDALKANKMEKVDINEQTLKIVDEDHWDVPDETTVQEVIQAIRELPDPNGIVTQLFLLEGYDHQEISEILGITESASRTYLYRGKKQIREQLKYDQDGTGY